MTKKEHNEQYKLLINDGKLDFDILMQCYALLDKQVSKYAYLKKQFENAGIANETNIGEFYIVIKKRNEIEWVLKKVFEISVKDIKNTIKETKTIITIANCEAVVELIKSRRFKVIS